jgi:hypothetical protein
MNPIARVEYTNALVLILAPNLRFVKLDHLFPVARKNVNGVPLKGAFQDDFG